MLAEDNGEKHALFCALGASLSDAASASDLPWSREQIIDVMAKHRLPAMYQTKEEARAPSLPSDSSGTVA
jgi:hypothetical protein